ncbi:hypothetical protein, partial [uncultured Gammaproteobacteria bacterium]
YELASQPLKYIFRLFWLNCLLIIAPKLLLNFSKKR